MAKKDWLRSLLIGLGFGLGLTIINQFGWSVFAGFVLVYTAILWLVVNKMKS